MGIAQSFDNHGQPSEDSSAQQQGRRMTCYYELLGIDVKSSEDEYALIRAYRKKALELHPDRNLSNVTASTTEFADLQAAYEILSNPHDRAWYDNHREAILGGRDPSNISESSHDSTTTDAIYEFMTKLSRQSQHSGISAESYSLVRTMFDTLASEEATASMLQGIEIVQYPSFGDPESVYSEVVRPFYAEWVGFATKKSFGWKDVHRLSTAPERQIRRWMEKENKALRDLEARKYSEAVRTLVEFVRKRDLRYTENLQDEAQRQRSLKDAASAQAARARAANQAKISRQVLSSQWTDQDTLNTEVDGASASEEECAAQEIFECIICDKSFKSEKQYEAHEKSKKHIKLTREVRRQMAKDDQQLGMET